MPELLATPDLRSLIGPYTEWTSDNLHQRFPNLQADHLSFAGAALVATGAVAAIHERPKLALGLNLAGAATDAFNGALARVCYGRDESRLARGNKVDSASDLIKDLAMSTAKIVTARRGNRSRAALAELSAVTTPIASWSRAHKESQGYKISEHGDSYFEFLGTRAARTALHAVGASNISLRGAPLQPVLDGIIIAGNLTRIKKNLTGSERETKTPSAKRKAQFRSKFHLASAIATGAGILTSKKLP